MEAAAITADARRRVSVLLFCQSYVEHQHTTLTLTLTVLWSTSTQPERLFMYTSRSRLVLRCAFYTVLGWAVCLLYCTGLGCAFYTVLGWAAPSILYWVGLCLLHCTGVGCVPSILYWSGLCLQLLCYQGHLSAGGCTVGPRDRGIRVIVPQELEAEQVQGQGDMEVRAAAQWSASER